MSPGKPSRQPRGSVMRFALFVCLLACATGSGAETAPNVLFISVDDLNDWVGCLGGHPQVKTPNLDKLAASGVLFDNAHCPAPACNPSRTAIMTGISPHRSGLYRNGQKMREVLPDAELLPKYFSRHGYWAGGSGKILHYFIDARSWDEYYPEKETENPFPPHVPWGKRPKSLPRGGPWQYVETDWHAFDVTDDEFGGDAKVADWVSAKLMVQQDKPFFLACGIYRPHEPWFVPKKYFDLFPLDSIQLPPGYKTDDLDDLPPAGKRHGPNRYFAHIREHGQWKRAIQAYLASIAFADAMLGRVIDTLEKSPHRDNTVVVLWSDHGWHLGEKQHWQKFTVWRRVTRVPFVIRVPPGAPGLPQGTTAGSVCSKPVNLLSIFPTLTELCGLPSKASHDGPSLVPLLRDPTSTWHHVSLTYLHRVGSFGLSTESWRYIRYVEGGEELYHIESDPHEWTNLAAKPEHSDKLAELRALGPTTFAPVAGATSRAKERQRGKPGESRPNILFIAVDDLRPELGCYGAEEIRTPNIDALAASGVRFDRAYCQSAVCNPSRASILTGKRPDEIRVWDLRAHFRDLNPDIVTLPQHFKRHGYYAVAHGKVFHNPLPDRQSWSEPNHWPERAKTWTADGRRQLARQRRKMRADGKSEVAIQRMRAPATEVQHVADSQTPDGEIADQAIASLRRLATNKERPFFLATGFIRPHLPFVAPREYWDLYDRGSLALAKNDHLPDGAPAMAMNTMYELRDYMDFAGTPSPANGALSVDQQRRLKHGYYACVSLIDAQVGRLLRELDTLGIADETIVVLWGDHGWKLGEHRSWCKQTNYEIDTRVPLIVRAPGATANGSATDALVELVDVYPTLCDLAGIPTPSGLGGMSMTPLLAKPNRAWKTAAFSQFRRRVKGVEYVGYAMRTESHRLVEWREKTTGKITATELYDHRVDAAEDRNIAGSSKVVEELRAMLHTSVPLRTWPRAWGLRSAKGTAGVSMRLENGLDEPIDIFWIDFNGSRRHRVVLEPGKKWDADTFESHIFVAVGKETGYHQVLRSATNTSNVIIGKAAGKKAAAAAGPARRPNVVVLMADDWSWPHAGILGDPTVKTPNIDRVARVGVLFTNAFVSTPSCTPSRLSVLTGQHHWRLKEGDSLGGSLREEYDVYTEMLQKSGYRLGRFGKGVWPSKHTFRERDSFGERFRSFDEFIRTRQPGEPFCYWHGGKNPHRPYQWRRGVEDGIALDGIDVPACLPDDEAVRIDLADYYWEVQRFDREVGEVVDRLEAMGELENTVVVVSGDNGMPFPRCKATLYDLGTRVPLAVRWGAKVKGNRRVEDFVSLCDLAPTFLEAAGLKRGESMTGRSLLPILLSGKSGRVEPSRTHVLTGMERHVYSWPSRALRNRDYLYIRNYGPATWPTGEVPGENPKYDFATEPWPTGRGAFSFNIDPSPTKQFLRWHREDPNVRRVAALSFSPRPDEELYDLNTDPEQVRNVAADASYRRVLSRLRTLLDAELVASQDPRAVAAEGTVERDSGGP